MTVAGFFGAVVAIQIFSKQDVLKIGIFVLWAAYGVIPTIHWMFTMGGWDNPIVQVCDKRFTYVFDFQRTTCIYYFVFYL